MHRNDNSIVASLKRRLRGHEPNPETEGYRRRQPPLIPHTPVGHWSGPLLIGNERQSVPAPVAATTTVDEAPFATATPKSQQRPWC